MHDGAGVVRIQGDAALGVAVGVLELACRQQDHAENAVATAIRRVQLDRSTRVS